MGSGSEKLCDFSVNLVSLKVFLKLVLNGCYTLQIKTNGMFYREKGKLYEYC